MSSQKTTMTREKFMSLSVEEKAKFLLQEITEVGNGTITNCQCETGPQYSQERLAEIYKSMPNYEGSVEIDLTKAKFSLCERKGDSTKKKKMYSTKGTNMYMISDQHAYEAEFSDESIPMKIRVGKNEDKDILVARMQYDKDKYLYFSPDVCIIMGLIDRQPGIKDANYIVVYDRIHGACNKCTMVALPDCGATFNMIEFIKILTKALATQNGEDR